MELGRSERVRRSYLAGTTIHLELVIGELVKMFQMPFNNLPLWKQVLFVVVIAALAYSGGAGEGCHVEVARAGTIGPAGQGNRFAHLAVDSKGGGEECLEDRSRGATRWAR